MKLKINVIKSHFVLTSCQDQFIKSQAVYIWKIIYLYIYIINISMYIEFKGVNWQWIHKDEIYKNV